MITYSKMIEIVAGINLMNSVSEFVPSEFCQNLHLSAFKALIS